MENQKKHKEMLNGYFLSLYYFSVPLAILGLFIINDTFLIRTLSVSVEDEAAISTLIYIGWIGICNLIFLISFFSCFICMIVYSSTHDSNDLKKIFDDKNKVIESNIFIFLVAIFSMKLSSVLSKLFLGLILFIFVAIAGTILAFIPWAIFIRIFDFSYYGNGAVLIIVKSFVFLILSGFIARKLLNSSVEKILV